MVLSQPKATLLLFSLIILRVRPFHQTESSDGLKMTGVVNIAQWWKSLPIRD